MEVSKTPEGKIIVTLGGVLYNSCTNDFDCPGFALCALNNPKLAYPAMCVCPAPLGLTGALCDQPDAYGLAGGIISCVVCAVGCISAIVLAFASVKLVRFEGFKRNALHSTMVFLMCALIALILESGPFAHEILAPAFVARNANQRRPANEVLVTVSIALTFFFITIASLNVSLVWIAMADAAQKLSRNAQGNVYRYRYVLIAYYAVFFVGMIVLLVGGNPVGSALFAIPGIVIIVTTYLVGWYKMKTLIENLQVSGTISKESVQAKKLNQSLKEISWTAIALSIDMCLIIIFFVVWISLGGFGGNLPGNSINLIMIEIVWLFVSFAGAILTTYLVAMIMRRTSAAEIKPTSSNNDTNESSRAAATPGAGKHHVAVVAANSNGGE